MTRIDLHAHLSPPSYVDELERRALRPEYLTSWTADIAQQMMDRWEIDAMVVSPSPPGVWFRDQGLADELARLLNEETARVIRDAPERFAGCAILPLPSLESALEELSYALDVLKLDGVELFTNTNGTYLGDPELDPLFDALDQRGAYVFVHPNSPPYGPPLGYHEYLIEYPMETTRAMVNLLYSGTLERCRRLRLQFAHLGGMTPFVALRIASLTERMPQFGEATPDGPLSYLRRQYYDTGLSNNVIALAATLRVTNLDHIVFGTDWPYLTLPADGADPAPGLSDALQPAERVRVEAANGLALVPRLGVSGVSGIEASAQRLG
ncbi:MAG: amidohydrolase [Solirubrobacterales bacterium]|nr:amidohydrolase [Solirubrobacterales bacterium]